MLIKQCKVKSKIFNFFIRYKITRCIIYLLLRIKHRSRIKNATAECDLRKDVGLFEYNRLSEIIDNPYIINEIQFYGFYSVLAKYINKPKLKKLITNEHGFIFSSYVSNNFFTKSIVLTFSDYREKLLLKKYGNKLNVVKIGPYIHYADSILSCLQKEELKKELGKTLLVFPFHSIDGVLSSFDVSNFIEKIDEYKIINNFDNVLVCLYWKDIQIGRAEKYLSKGYKVTTAGHIYDIYFLNRLRTIIELSDFVLSNELGTYIGYCLCLNKQIRLINQKSEFTFELGNEDHINRQSFLAVENHFSEYNRLQDKLQEILSIDNKKQEDLQFINELFGLQYLKSPVEMMKYIN